jgi:transposase
VCGCSVFFFPPSFFFLIADFIMFYLGIDVAKAKLDCCLLLSIEDGKRKTKSVANTARGFSDLLRWIDKQGLERSQVRVLMEGTGVYHTPAATALSDAQVSVSILNPARVREYAKSMGMQTKNDKADSIVIALYGAKHPEKLIVWEAPSLQARTLQALLARREALERDLQRERNRQEKADFIDTPERITKSLEESIAFLKEQIKKLSKDIDGHIKQYPELKEQMALLTSIPAVGPKTGAQMLSILHHHRFERPEQLSAYIGLNPVEFTSGSSVFHRPHLSKAGPGRVRAVLYMAAVVATRHNPVIKAQYQRLISRGKSKMSALGAAMRKLVHLCFGVLKNRTPFNPNYAFGD